MVKRGGVSGAEGRESTYNTQLTVKCRTGEGSTEGEGCGKGALVIWKATNQVRFGSVDSARGSGPCLLVDKVNGKSVFHARSINTAPARRDKFL